LKGEVVELNDEEEVSEEEEEEIKVVE